MFKTVKELKAFILWAAENKVKRVKVGDFEAEISDIAFIQELTGSTSSQINQEVEIKPLTENEAAPKDDEDLYWSVTN